MIDGLKMKYRAAIIDALAANDRVERAILFGSRATDTYTTASDIDIALIGDRLTLADQVRLNAVMEALTVPQRVDLLLYTMIDNDALRKNIDMQGVEWYCRQASERSELPYLLPRHRAVLEAMLGEYLPGVEAWAYSSCAEVSGQFGIKLDLVLRGLGLKKVQNSKLADFEKALKDSIIPFPIRMHDWACLPERIHREIEQCHLVPMTNMKPRTGASWKETSLSKCIQMNDSFYSLEEAWPFINYLDTGNITENRVREIRRLIPGKDKIPSRARRKARTGDILYSTVRPNQRHFGLLKEIPENFLVSTGFSVFRGRAGIAITDYIYWFLVQDHIIEWLQAVAEHSTSAYPSIRPFDIQSLTLALPPLPEQLAISRVLGTLDEKIEVNRRMNETLEAITQEIFKDWFVDFGPVRTKMEGREPYLKPDIWKLFPSNLNDDTHLPEGWKQSEIGKEVEVLGGATPSTKEPAYWTRGTNCWATPKDLSKLGPPVLLDTGRKISNAGASKISSGILPIGTVLLSSRAPIGYLAITEVPTAVNQGFIAMICKKRLPNIFVLLWCRDKLDFIKGVSGGSTFAEISKRSFRPIPVIIPSAELIDSFEKIVRPLYDRIVANSKEIELLTWTRNLLVPKLMSGEICLCDVQKKAKEVICE